MFRKSLYKLKVECYYIIIQEEEEMFFMLNVDEKKFKVGDKVVPLKKSVWGNLNSSVEWKKAKEKGQDYLYIVGYSFYNNAHILSAELGVRGDFFLDDDLQLYKEQPTIEGTVLLKENFKDVNLKISKKLEELKELEEERENISKEILQNLEQILESSKELEQKQSINKEALAKVYLRSNIKEGIIMLQNRFIKAHFVIKEKKGKVSLVLKGAYSGNILSHTESKCMAVDKFSEVVGKAICLARALGDKEIEQELIK